MSLPTTTATPDAPIETLEETHPLFRALIPRPDLSLANTGQTSLVPPSTEPQTGLASPSIKTVRGYLQFRADTLKDLQARLGKADDEFPWASVPGTVPVLISSTLESDSTVLRCSVEEPGDMVLTFEGGVHLHVKRRFEGELRGNPEDLRRLHAELEAATALTKETGGRSHSRLQFLGRSRAELLDSVLNDPRNASLLDQDVTIGAGTAGGLGTAHVVELYGPTVAEASHTFAKDFKERIRGYISDSTAREIGGDKSVENVTSTFTVTFSSKPFRGWF